MGNPQKHEIPKTGKMRYIWRSEVREGGRVWTYKGKECNSQEDEKE